jgi:hypothetical protein
MTGHERNDRVNLAYHRAIAERLLSDPGVLARARERVDAWAERGTVHRHYVDEWQSVLQRHPQEIASLLADEGAHAMALRQVSPFAGVLTPRERWAIWRELRGSARDQVAT